jgi:spermidine synthase
VSRRVGSSGYLRQEVDTGVAELVADPDRAAAWTLLVDGTPQSYVDLDDPERLPFGYVRQLGHLIDLAAPAGTPLRVLHLGAGALSLARYVAATRPGSAQVAVDADGALVGLVRERLPLDRRGQRGPGRIRVRVADARAVAEGAAGQDWDVIVADLFTAGRTPAHLTSAEFTAAVAGALAPGGVFAANVGDGPPLAHARARVATTRAAFPHVSVTGDGPVLNGRRFGNLVIAASGQSLPVAGLAARAAASPFPARLIHGAELDRFAAGAQVISDATAVASPAPD